MITEKQIWEWADRIRFKMPPVHPAEVPWSVALVREIVAAVQSDCVSGNSAATTTAALLPLQSDKERSVK